MIDLDAIEARTLAAYEEGLEQEQRDDLLALLRIARAAHQVAMHDWSSGISRAHERGKVMISLRNALRSP